MDRTREIGTQSFMQPSAQCQACLSDKSPDRDFIFTCELCQSSIHSKHYGREIDDPKEQAIDKWYCERCRMICEYAEQQKYAEIEAMKCHFCPNNRGILKRIIFNTTETIWVRIVPLSSILSATHGPIPSSTKKTIEGFTIAQNTPNIPPASFGSTCNRKQRPSVRYAKSPKAIK